MPIGSVGVAPGDGEWDVVLDQACVLDTLV